MSSEAEQKTTDSEQLALENEPKEDVGPGIIDKEVESSEASKQVEPSNLTGTNKKENEKEPENHLATPTLAENTENEPAIEPAPPTMEETTVNTKAKDVAEVFSKMSRK